jgi:hypothetical protein
MFENLIMMCARKLHMSTVELERMLRSMNRAQVDHGMSVGMR